MTMGLTLGMEELRAALPQPELPRRPELVELYWYAWQLAARMVRHGTPENNFSPTYVDAAFGGNIFQWDTCFIATFARYSRELIPVLPAFDNFYRLQDTDGYIAREYRWENGARLWAKRSGDSLNPPLFAWAEWQVYRLTADRERLRTVWPHLDSYYRYLEQWHRNDDGTYWITDMGSGMDNTPRFAAGWIDMTCQQALNATMLSTIARELGDDVAAEHYREQHQTLANVINSHMWDEADGFYWDVDAAGLAIKSKTVAAFWPLLAGVTSQLQAAKLVGHLNDPQTFWRTHPFPSLAADHPFYKPHGDYWLGSVWAPTNYMVIKGLTRAGYADFALEATLRHLQALERVYRNTGTLWENYRADEDAPGIPARRDFVGWTGCGPIALLLEDVIGIWIDAHKAYVRWTIREDGPHGVKQLPFGPGLLDLHIDAQRTLTVRCESSLQLEADGVRGTGKWSFAAGTHTVTLP
ncbi:MAG: hypothetical protein H0X37_07475 [Herpetosiphonaceae bacterium]|nr:hypothetical protein [Herpetosiphonaceae bacterium]